MSIMNQNTRERVTEILEEFKPHRDSDHKLISRIWQQDLLALGYDTLAITADQFLRIHAAGKLTHSESIRRMRAKIQEEREDLRGESYQKRQTEAQHDATEALGYPEGTTRPVKTQKWPSGEPEWVQEKRAKVEAKQKDLFQ